MTIHTIHAAATAAIALLWITAILIGHPFTAHFLTRPRCLGQATAGTIKDWHTREPDGPRHPGAVDAGRPSHQHEATAMTRPDPGLTGPEIRSYQARAPRAERSRRGWQLFTASALAGLAIGATWAALFWAGTPVSCVGWPLQ